MCLGVFEAKEYTRRHLFGIFLICCWMMLVDYKWENVLRSTFGVYIVFCLMQRYIEQHNEVELSALGMGTFSEYLLYLYFSLLRYGAGKKRMFCNSI